MRIPATNSPSTLGLFSQFMTSRSDLADAHSRLIVEYKDKEDPEGVPLEQGDMFVEELEDFARAVRTGGKPEVGIDEGIAVVAVAEAALRSAETGQVQSARALFNT